MFFGKPAKEEVKSDSLKGILDSLFGKKLGKFEPRAAAIVKEIKKAKIEFEGAADKLETLDAEPYIEGVYSSNIKSIKGQKGPYAKTLKRIMGELDLDIEGEPNVYATYKKILSNVEGTALEILKANASFKVVMYCYATHMSTLKSSFSSIERLKAELAQEVGARSIEESEYNAITANLSRLSMQTEEITTLEASIRMLKDGMDPGRRTALEKEEAELSGSMSKRHSELLALKAENSTAEGKVNSLLISLDKTSKRYDYASSRKRHLNDFVLDPVGNMRSDSDYAEFRSMLENLRDMVDSGTITVKNKDETLKLIAALLGSDIYSMTKSLTPTREKISYLENEIRIMERSLDDLGGGKKDSEKSARDIAAMGEKIAEVKKAKESTKLAIETMFSSYYRKEITVAE